MGDVGRVALNLFIPVDNTVGCFNHNLMSCGFLFVDILTIAARPEGGGFVVGGFEEGARAAVTASRAAKAAKIEQAVKAGKAAETAARMPGVIRVGKLKLPGVLEGAIGTPVRTGKGLEYQIPRGTPELNPRVTRIRVMDPVTTGKHQYPNGYVSYMNKGGQAVHPLTGETLQPADPLWHIELT